jgi:hypothetical protein
VHVRRPQDFYPARRADVDRAVLDRMFRRAAWVTAVAARLGVPAGNPDILAAIEATGASTAVLVGLETDVCVAHSAANRDAELN